MPRCPRCGARYLDERLRVCAADGAELVADEGPPSSSAGAFERSLKPGEMVGEYQIESRIGEGGFGVVYRAVQPLIGKKVAVKVLARQYATGDLVVERFVAEARAVNRIRHRNIIDIFSFGVLPDGRHYYVMELLEGETLDELLGRVGSLSPELAIELLRPVARALDAAHAAGIAHRDLKPENIFLAIDRDDEVFPKLLDFGIAKLFTGGGAAAGTTGGGLPVGTPHFMSPEQCRGRDVDQRTDIYSFGVLTFRALTGRLPFEGDEAMGVMMAQVSARPPAPSALCPSLPPSVDGPLLQMLAKDPQARPGSVLQAIEALAAACGLTPTPLSSTSLLPPALLESGTRLDRGSWPRAPESRRGAGSAPPGPLPAGDPSAASGVSLLTMSASGVGLMPPGSSRGSRAASSALVVASLVAIGVGGFWLGRRGAGGPGRAEAPAAEAPAARGEARAALRPAAPPEPARAAASVRVLVRATPPAEVYLGGRRLGSTVEPLALPRGEGPITLTLRAEGYRASTLELTPDGDRELSVLLTKKAPPAAAPAPAPSKARPAADGELDDPFD